MEGKFVFAAAQVPFATAEGFHFCTLVPISNVDGEPVNAQEDFPNSGLCWFMLRDVRFQGLTPGQLVVGPVEHSRDWSTSAPDRHWFQLRVETAQMAGAADTVLEVLDAGPEEAEGPRVLISPQREMYVDHRPTDLVIVRLGHRFYGPFRAKARRDESLGDGSWRVSLERTSQNKVLQADDVIVAKAGGLVETGDIRVSLDDAPPTKATLTRPIRYSFIPWHHFEKLKQAGAFDIELLTDAEILGRIARDHLKPKIKRQQLQQLLRELDENLQPVSEASAKAALSAIGQLSVHLAASERLGEELLEALVASRALDAQIEGLKEKRFQEYIEARAAEAQSRISDRVREVQKQHEALRAEMDRLKQERDDKRAQVETEIRESRARANADIEEERRRLDEQREALHREQETLATAVSQAAVRFSEGRSELLSDLLTLVPALQATGVLSSSISQAAPPQEELARAVPLPAPFTTSHDRARQRLDEREFFDRFTRHVQASGFHYRDTDLKALHIPVKCADLTILTGLSGVGKSSLVRLYAEALAGEDRPARARLLTIDVSPSWTEPQDILGNVNLLDRRFEPASCGLFNHLVAAAREHGQAGSHAGMVLIALDEMNLGNL